MGKAKDTCDEINAITGKLIENSLSDNQKFARLRRISSSTEEVCFGISPSFSIILKNVPYEDMYGEIKKSGDYNVAMADGALIQLQYTFEDNIVTKHRLAFLPSPDLSVYQNEPEIYESDLIFAEVVARNVVATPIRFDFDRDAYVANIHPMAHCTIGQYRNCRIPVAGAISPHRFFEFILSSFYNTAFRNFSSQLGSSLLIHPATITTSEQERIHLSLKSQP